MAPQTQYGPVTWTEKNAQNLRSLNRRLRDMKACMSPLVLRGHPDYLRLLARKVRLDAKWVEATGGASLTPSERSARVTELATGRASF